MCGDCLRNTVGTVENECYLGYGYKGMKKEGPITHKPSVAYLTWDLKPQKYPGRVFLGLLRYEVHRKARCGI